VLESSPTLINNWYSINLTNGKDYINQLSANAGLTQIRIPSSLTITMTLLSITLARLDDLTYVCEQSIKGVK
jgi:hypothetical protein